MTSFYLPAKLQSRLEGYISKADNVGRSSSRVVRFSNAKEAVFLKVDERLADLRRECDVLRWLSGKLPVPKVLDWVEDDGVGYLLMSESEGRMCCDETDGDVVLASPKALAQGIKLFQSIDIHDCPFDHRLDKELSRAAYNIKHNLVDMDDWEHGSKNAFETPENLLKFLEANRPDEDLCFCHGDYCLPNVFFDGENVTGFIDLGNAGIADRYEDIAMCVRSLGYNLEISGHGAAKQRAIDELFSHLGIVPDWDKINYYILLDELF
jgi:kanamycin kinase/aminoglycoside 3'-phosphotransferase-3